MAATGAGAPIIVLDADDVVLAEIAAGLHLDQFEQDLARKHWLRFAEMSKDVGLGEGPSVVLEKHTSCEYFCYCTH